MRRHRTLCVALSLGGLCLAGPGSIRAQVPIPSTQAPPPRAARPSEIELRLLRALQVNPLTAAYAFDTEPRGKKIALKGRVGTKQVHDIAIQTALALGVPVVDDLIIDTEAAHQAAAFAGQPGYPGGSGAGYAGGYTPSYPMTGFYGSVPYIYPQPILGKLDDPFYGFEPPVISYPPYWGALTGLRLGPQPPPMAPGPMGNFQGQDNNQNAGPEAQPSAEIPYGTVDMAIDPRGVATLRGTVPSLAERITLGQKVAQTPGVTEVVNLLNVQPNAPAPSDNPPPPPTPAPPPDAQAIRPEVDPVDQRATRAVESRAALSGLPVQVKVREGVASLTGKVPTVYEAMLAYRAVEQTPGVREVVDRLEFVVPDGTGPNPLIEKGRPEDVEPYLEAQIRRQVGDLAHIDRVRTQGNVLDLRGTLGREEDRDRFDAILRSMPILRGYRLTAEVAAESR
ncbi:BON domain-containing protein [Tundrisphaera lichenicola]|uniref:BON domain-containing protein n=1 Tax=Tundrisphaera lichenicola TaxID=2029860 RepID=UPI003EBD5CFE